VEYEDDEDEGCDKKPDLNWKEAEPEKDTMRFAVACSDSADEALFRQRFPQNNDILVCKKCGIERSLSSLVENYFRWECEDGWSIDITEKYDANHNVLLPCTSGNLVSLYTLSEEEFADLNVSLNEAMKCMQPDFASFLTRTQEKHPDLKAVDPEGVRVYLQNCDDIAEKEEFTKLRGKALASYWRPIIIESITTGSFAKSRILIELCLTQQHKKFVWLNHGDAPLQGLLPETILLSKQSSGLIVDASKLQSVLLEQVIPRRRSRKLTTKLIAITMDNRAILQFQTPDGTFIKLEELESLTKVTKATVVRLCNQMMDEDDFLEFKNDLENEVITRQNNVPRGIILVHASSIYNNILVQQSCQLNIQTRQFIKWEESKKLLVTEDNQVILPRRPENHDPVDDCGVRNRFLSDILSIYGKQGLYIMISLLSHSAAHLFQHLRNHQRGAFLLVGLSQNFKSYLLKAHAMAMGCSKNIVGELHSPSTTERLTEAALLMFDDIGKSGGAAKFNLADMAAMIRTVFDVGTSGTRGNVREAKCAITASLNQDNYAAFCSLDDDEETLGSRTVCMCVAEKNQAQPTQYVRVLSDDEQSGLVRSLALLKFETNLLNEYSQKLAASRNRQTTLVATRMVYAMQIFTSFIEYEPDCWLKAADFESFVINSAPRQEEKESRQLKRTKAKLRAFIRDNLNNLSVDEEDNTVLVPLSAVFDLETTDLQNLIGELRKKNIIVLGSNSVRPRSEHWKRKPQYLIDLDALGEMEGLGQAGQAGQAE
jgi:hypothetical protein